MNSIATGKKLTRRFGTYFDFLTQSATLVARKSAIRCRRGRLGGWKRLTRLTLGVKRSARLAVPLRVIYKILKKGVFFLSQRLKSPKSFLPLSRFWSASIINSRICTDFRFFSFKYISFHIWQNILVDESMIISVDQILLLGKRNEHPFQVDTIIDSA